MNFKSVCFIVTISICIGLLPGSSGEKYSKIYVTRIKACLSLLCSVIQSQYMGSMRYSSFKDWYNEISEKEPQDVTTMENWVQKRMDEYTTTLQHFNVNGAADKDTAKAIECINKVIKDSKIENNINGILEDARKNLNSSGYYSGNKGFDDPGTSAGAGSGY